MTSISRHDLYYVPISNISDNKTLHFTPQQLYGRSNQVVGHDWRHASKVVIDQ